MDGQFAEPVLHQTATRSGACPLGLAITQIRPPSTRAVPRPCCAISAWPRENCSLNWPRRPATPSNCRPKVCSISAKPRGPRARDGGAGASLANELGVEARALDARQTAEMEPGARLEVAGAIYFPIDAHLTPGKLIPTLVALLKQEGVSFHWNTRVDGWSTEAGRITAVSTSKGNLVADEYVMATRLVGAGDCAPSRSAPPDAAGERL